MRNWHEKTLPYQDEGGQEIAGAAMINDKLAQQMQSAGVDDIEISLDTEITPYWTIIPQEKTITPYPGFTIGASALFTIGYPDRNIAYYLYEYVLKKGPLVNTVLGSQLDMSFGAYAAFNVSTNYGVKISTNGDILTIVSDDRGSYQSYTCENYGTGFQGNLHWPIQMIGPSCNGVLSAHKYNASDQYLIQIPITRYVNHTHLSESPYKNIKYKTYYVKEIN